MKRSYSYQKVVINLSRVTPTCYLRHALQIIKAVHYFSLRSNHQTFFFHLLCLDGLLVTLGEGGEEHRKPLNNVSISPRSLWEWVIDWLVHMNVLLWNRLSKGYSLQKLKDQQRIYEASIIGKTRDGNSFLYWIILNVRAREPNWLSEQIKQPSPYQNIYKPKH